MTAQSIADRVRMELRDTEAPFRWSDPDLLLLIEDVMREIFRVRPDAAAVSRIVVECPTPPASMADTVAFRDAYGPALVYGVCARAIGRDSEEAANAAVEAKFQARFQGALA